MSTYAEYVSRLHECVRMAKASRPYVLEEDVEKAAKLASQWPKLHRCRLAPDIVQITEEEWKSWPLYGSQEDAFADYEMKHCRCGSTLMALTKIHDLEAE